MILESVGGQKGMCVGYDELERERMENSSILNI